MIKDFFDDVAGCAKTSTPAGDGAADIVDAPVFQLRRLLHFLLHLVETLNGAESATGGKHIGRVPARDPDNAHAGLLTLLAAGKIKMALIVATQLYRRTGSVRAFELNTAFNADEY
jgi:hypothetical protein